MQAMRTTSASTRRAGYWPYQTPSGPDAGSTTPDQVDDAANPADVVDLLYERYADGDRESGQLSLYYALKPFIPRSVQLTLRRLYARRQRRRLFPAWPAEPVLVNGQYDALRSRLASEGRVFFVNFWPDALRFCVTITHDVESAAGIANIPRVLEVEQRHGVRSSWNFCADWYAIPDGLFTQLRSAGCEVGLHGLRHDGRLFQSRRTFEDALPGIHAYLSAWDAVGFRSPATHRNAEWMPEIGALYDSSFPDTDPFEPQAGGCCSIFPFFLGDMVELPITLVQDHTLFDILGERSIDLWIAKSAWIARHHGLVNLIAHPDYLIDDHRLALYEQFVRHLAAQEGAWHALPADVASWWRSRAGLRLERSDGLPAIAPGASTRATVAEACLEDGQVFFDLRPEIDLTTALEGAS
jgi:peptidoglycan/xylan/chitin deacetylase (PgdA/CDA1 family)